MRESLSPLRNMWACMIDRCFLFIGGGGGGGGGAAALSLQLREDHFFRMNNACIGVSGLQFR